MATNKRQRRSQPFRGRAAEQDQLSRLLDMVRAGESVALVVRGEAGIGKTALLEHFTQQVTGFRVVRCVGTESEMELPFAALHQLCAPMLSDMDHLPEPQQNALQVALGVSTGTVPDRFLVALATLSLLAEVAQKRPLLCFIDDAHWLDSASGQVLGFVARRLLAESIFMVFAIREPNEDRYLLGLPDLVLLGLGDGDAQALLATATPGRVDSRVADRIVAETRGNPQAILELPTSMTAAELAGGFADLGAADLRTQLEDHLLRRLSGLPQSTRRLLLIAASDPTGDEALLWRAAQSLGIGREAAAGLNAEALVSIEAGVRFRPPLVRSAIYSGASVDERRSVHLALAAAMDTDADADRQIWHLALATAGPDEEVALELERSAGRAQLRGGLASAGAFLQRSVALTRDAGLRVERALRAGQVQVQAGAFAEALRLLAIAEIEARTDLQRASVDLLRGQIARAAGPLDEASARLLDAAKRLEPLDLVLARETYLDAWAAAMYTGQLGQLQKVSKAAQSAGPSSKEPHLTELLLDGLSLVVTDGRRAAIPTLHRVIARLTSEELSVERGLQWAALASAAATMLWDFESMAAVVSHQAEAARRTGALTTLSFALTGEVFCLAWQGDLAAAALLAAEAEALTDAIGVRQAPMGSLLLQALTGDEEGSSFFIEAVIDAARARGEDTAVQIGMWTAAILANSMGRYEQALSCALVVSRGPLEFLILPWALPELIEAAVRTGNDVLAADAVQRLRDSTSDIESNWAQGTLARCLALVSDGEVAEEHYKLAVECFRATALRPEYARAHLLYGEWLRRQNRRIDARGQLRSAYNLFSEIGMLSFAERARHELQATGETVRKRGDEHAREGFTPQEDQIARLALQGLTNSEIGGLLFISSRTVEWHLHKVFAKLGITSRRALREALPGLSGKADRR